MQSPSATDLPYRAMAIAPLSRETEQALFLEYEKIQKKKKRLHGRLAKDANNQQLQAKIQAILDQEHRIKETLIRAHILSIAKFALPSTASVNFADLVQEGVRKLIEVMKTFKLEMRIRFSTYLIRSVRRRFMDVVAEQGRLFRLRAPVLKEAYNYQALVQTLMLQLGRKPRDEEVAEAGNWKPRLARVLQRINTRPVSIDVPEGFEELPASYYCNIDGTPDAELSGCILRAKLRKKLAILLTPVQRRILRLRFGILSKRPMPPRTLEQVGEIMGLSHERIRQLQAEAFARLRHSKEFLAIQQ
jgi:RNA polymerase primary sigma factor